MRERGRPTKTDYEKKENIQKLAREIVTQLTKEQLDLLMFHTRKHIGHLTDEETTILKAKRNLIRIILEHYPLRAVGIVVGLSQEGVRYNMRKLDNLI